ncbi:MAG: cobalt-precorrin-5B (C(1))-methyltransferase CbiD [Candidatus Adiutrix sp.]|jgi:cobalt-precorrin-5B (C1)-methyltransferase|nr:cobalt-precorrin-5B (C(1))-methyltransferase CbiD [Candidatus Adiutrix sp.]
MPEIKADLAEPPGRRGRLRQGFTTGTAAAAAALAACEILLGRPGPDQVIVRLPDGRDLTVKIADSRALSLGEARALVIKDAGDDPDVTNKARIGALVRRRTGAGAINIIGGPGVGRVTKPGLALAPGQWAINPGPQAMLRANLTPKLTAGLPGLEVEIFVEKGEELARQTLNPRLGIVGGLSILGTTGLVKPFSNEAYLATIESALNLARAAGLEEVVLTTGRQSENLIMAARRDLPDEAFIQVADFFGDSLEMTAARSFAAVGLAVFFGKAVKQAAGHRNTHAHRHDQDLAALAGWLEPETGRELAARLEQALTARGALEILREAGLPALAARVAGRALAQARRFAGPNPRLWLTMFDYDNGQVLANQTLERP